jgi:hypothetical protein
LVEYDRVMHPSQSQRVCIVFECATIVSRTLSLGLIQPTMEQSERPNSLAGNGTT